MNSNISGVVDEPPARELDEDVDSIVSTRPGSQTGIDTGTNTNSNGLRTPNESEEERSEVQTWDESLQ